MTTADAISEFKSAKKVLTNTIKDMGIFNSTVFTSEAGDILEEQNTQLSSLSDLGSSSYTSKKAKDFYKDSTFKAEVKEVKSVVNGKARRDQLKNALAKNLYDSKYSGYLLESGAMALETAMPIMLTWQKSGKINQVLSKTSGVTEEELRSIGVGVKDNQEIVLYDNIYGYAKYTFEISASSKTALIFGKDGLASAKSGDTTLKKNGELTLPILDSALVDSDLIPSYQIQGASNGFGGLSGSISDDTSKTTYGIKVVNGILAAYGSVESTITLPDEIQIDDFPLKEKVTFEQGQYLRDRNSGPHMSKYDYWVEDADFETAGKIMKREAIKSLEFGTTLVATVAVGAFAVSTFGLGGLVVGSLAGGALGIGLIINHEEEKHEE
ncbi:hypothetical protein [Streptococcus gallolyticus]|uniref:hypothetical protein n=1 Tax=Streptococcus gallolyticus TaxID=315405 RepID=UPI003D6EE465